jgi:alpha-L-fucosidase
LGLPKSNSTLEVKHILDIEDSESIKGVSIVGSNIPIEWSAKNDVLVLHTPKSESMDEIATVFKVELEKN